MPRLLSPDGRLLAVSTKEKKEAIIRVLDVARKATLPGRSSGDPVSFLDGKLFLRQGERIKALDLSGGAETLRTPDGMRVLVAEGRVAVLIAPAAGPMGEEMVVWDLVADRPLDRVAGAVPDWAYLSGDASVLAYRDPSNRMVLRLREVRLGRALQSIGGVYDGTGRLANQSLGRVALNADGSLLAVRTSSHFIRVWEVASGRVLASLRDHGAAIWVGAGQALATEGELWVSREGGRAIRSAFPSNIYSVYLWDVAYTPSYSVGAGVEAIRVNSDGTQVATNDVVWEFVRTPDGPRLRATAQKDPGETLIGGDAGRAWTVQVKGKNEQRTLVVRQVAPDGGRPALEIPGLGSSKKFAITPDGKRLILGRRGPNINEPLDLWDLEGGKRLAEWDASAQWRVLLVSPDGRLVAADGANSGGLQVREVETGKMLHHLYNVSRNETRWSWKTRSHKSHFIWATPTMMSLVFSPDGSRLYSGDLDGKVHAFDLGAGHELGPWLGHKDRVLALAVSPNGRILASGSEDRTIRLWDTSTGRELSRWEADEAGVTALAFSADGSTLLSGSSEGTIKLWDLPRMRSMLARLGLAW